MKVSILAFPAAVLLTSGLHAQTQSAIVPLKYQASGNAQHQEPFAKQPVRFQQVFFKKELQEVIPKPVRMRGIRFRAKQTGNTGFSVDMQLAIGTITGIASSTFQANLANAELVVPRTTITLPTSTAGTFVVNLPFTKDFTWDRDSDIVIDVRIFGNGNQNRPFLYWFDAFFDNSTFGGERLWALGPNSTRSTSRFRGSGLVTRFDYQEGTAIKFGKGCKGTGGFIPEIDAGGIPVVGNTGLRMNLTQAKPQVPAILLWGSSRTKWGNINLPLDLRAVIPSCTLFVEPLMIFGAATQGGAPGTGIASVPFGIPALNLFKGIDLYAQWAIFDDGNITNRVIGLTFSNAIWISIG